MRPAWTISLLLGAAVALADDKPAPPTEKPAPPAEEGIAVAKREFDAVKSQRGARDSAKLELGGLAAPEIQVGGPAPQALPSASEATLAARKKSANWLVDAMAEAEKKKSVSDARDKKPDDRAPDKDADALSTARQEPRDANKSIEPAGNPLDRYMASWMSPHDFSLLRPVLAGDTTNFLSGRNETTLAGLDAGLGDTVHTDSLGLLPGGVPTTGIPAPPRENPFLEGLTPPPQTSLRLLPTTMAPANATNPTSSLLAPAPQPPPAKALTPDFVKPRTDEKYYKQMKRF